MAKRIYSATAGAGLDSEGTKSLSLYLEVDKSGYPETKNFTLDKLLRSLVTNTIDASGHSSVGLDFEDYELIDLTIDEDLTGTVVNLPANCVVYLKVTKGSTDTFTIAGLSGTPDERQQGLTGLYYRITSIDSHSMIERINSDYNVSLTTDKLSSESGTVTSFDHFNMIIRKDMMLLHGRFNFTTSESLTTLTISYTDANISFVNSLAPLSIVITNVTDGGIELAQAFATEDSIAILFSDTIGTSKNLLINISGTIHIE